MGNRILKESICMNRRINRLNDFQENMFYRLLVKADDFGVFTADPVLLAHMLYPRREGVDREKIGEAIRKMSELNLIRLYQHEGEAYLRIASWEKHQRIRNIIHRYPTPEECDAAEPAGSPQTGGEPRTAEAEAETAERREEKPAERKQPEPEPAEPKRSERKQTEPEPAELKQSEQEGSVRKRSAQKHSEQKQPEQKQAEPYGAAWEEYDAGGSEPPVIELPLNDNTGYGVTRGEVDEYAALYPAVDVEKELRNMRGWCLANPKRRKTRNGIRKFITGWLSRAQDRGGGMLPSRTLPDNPFIRMAMEDPEEREGRLVV